MGVCGSSHQLSAAHNLTHTMQTHTTTTQDRINTEILDLYFNEGWSQSYLADTYGRSESGIYRLIEGERMATITTDLPNGRERKKLPGKDRDPRRKDNQKPLSSVHARMGLLMARFRTERNLNYTAAGAVFGLSRIKFSQCETGSYDFTYSEFARLCETMHIKVTDVVDGTAIKKGA